MQSRIAQLHARNWPVGAERQQVELDVRGLELGPGAREDADLAGADRHRPGAEQRIAQRDAQLAPDRPEIVVDRARLEAAVDVLGLQVVLQVGADAVERVHHLDAVFAEQRAGADARELQELRRVDRAARQDHLAPGMRGTRRAAQGIVDADRAPALETHPAGQRMDVDAQVWPLARRLEIADRGAAAPAIAAGQLVRAGAFLGRSVEVVVARQAGLDGGLDIGVADLAVVGQVGDAERPADAVQRVGAALLVLGLLEVGQHVVPCPADVAELAPIVVVAGLAADVDQAVDR